MLLLFAHSNGPYLGRYLPLSWNPEKMRVFLPRNNNKNPSCWWFSRQFGLAPDSPPLSPYRKGAKHKQFLICTHPSLNNFTKISYKVTNINLASTPRKFLKFSITESSAPRQFQRCSLGLGHYIGKFLPKIAGFVRNIRLSRVSI